MSKNHNISLYKHFLEFEEKNNLLDLSINGVKFWQLIRHGTLSELKMKLIKIGKAHTSRNSMLDKIRFFPRVIYNSLTKNPLRGNYTKEVLIIDHFRKVKVDNYYSDIYTKDFINQLDDNTYEIIEYPFEWKHYTSRINSKIKYSDAITLNDYVQKILKPIKISNEDLKILKDLEKKIHKEFDVKISIVKKTEITIERFINIYNYYIKLFKKRKPKKVYVVISYLYHAMIAAAKELNIEVIEFQHGVITPYHIGYNYPLGTKEVDYFPNKLLTFGEYWNKAASFPENAEIEVYGFPYLNTRYNYYKKEVKNKKQILFLSQGTIGEKLSKLAYEISKRLPDYKIIYKLHPGEYTRWKSIYPDLLKASSLNNFKVIEDNKTDLYYFFAKSEFQVGVYSTAIFEGLTFECKTLLYNLPGIEYMDDLIDEGIVKKINNENEFLKYMNEFKGKEFDKSYFFK